MTLKKVKKIGYELTGLAILTSKYLPTYFVYNQESAGYININKKQLLNIYSELQWKILYNRFGINKKGIVLQALLHEVAHYKQYIKLGGQEYYKKMENNSDYYEKMANRYSTRYYKRFVKN